MLMQISMRSQIDGKSALICEMLSRQLGSKAEPILTQFTEAYLHHVAPVALKQMILVMGIRLLNQV